MFNFKPENLVGDTNKLLFSILTELKQLNESVQSLRPIARDTEIKAKVEKPKATKKPRESKSNPKITIKRGKKLDNK